MLAYFRLRIHCPNFAPTLTKQPTDSKHRNHRAQFISNGSHVFWRDKTVWWGGGGHKTARSEHKTACRPDSWEKGVTSVETKRAGFKHQPIIDKCSFYSMIVVYSDSSLHSSLWQLSQKSSLIWSSKLSNSSEKYNPWPKIKIYSRFSRFVVPLTDSVDWLSCLSREATLLGIIPSTAPFSYQIV